MLYLRNEMISVPFPQTMTYICPSIPTFSFSSDRVSKPVGPSGSQFPSRCLRYQKNSDHNLKTNMLAGWVKSLKVKFTDSITSSPASPSSSSPSPRLTASSSLKDVQDLLTEDSDQKTKGLGPKSTRASSIFHRVRASTSVIRALSHSHVSAAHSKLYIPAPPDRDQHRVIIYFTSLRIVRKTYEACRTVRSILRGFQVPIDERDVSMDCKLLCEIQEIMDSKKVSLPMVFIGGKFVGGAEEIKEMEETGELKKLICGLPLVDHHACNLCGGMRFTVCEVCNGSHKIYIERSGFNTCSACNANGLIRCPLCPIIRRRMSI